MQVTVNGVRLAQLADGECFGERALISAHAKRRATVTTRTYCQLFLLSRTAVQAAFAAHPHSWATLCRRAEMQWHTYSKSRLPAEHARGYEDEAAAAGPGQAPFSLERSLPKSVNGSLGSVKAEGCARRPAQPPCAMHPRCRRTCGTDVWVPGPSRLMAGGSWSGVCAG